MRNFFIFNREVSNELGKNPKMNFIIWQILWHFPRVLNGAFCEKKKAWNLQFTKLYAWGRLNRCQNFYYVRIVI